MIFSSFKWHWHDHNHVKPHWPIYVNIQISQLLKGGLINRVSIVKVFSLS
jgi:hypothetical protein